jgi:homogentisate 1,2-dioxygenase
MVPKGSLLGTFESAVVDPNQMRWNPLPMPDKDDKLDFVDGMRAKAVLGIASRNRYSPRVLILTAGLSTMMGAGDPTTKSGMAVHTYACNSSMVDTAMYNSDGDFLIVPQVTRLTRPVS